jgi:hypothetical protein
LVLRQIDDSRLNAALSNLERPASNERFDERIVAALPDPARRYLLHAIKPRSRLPGVAWLKMRGTVRSSADASWVPFEAEELLAAEGFVRRATISSRIQKVGFESYVKGIGRTAWRLRGVIPVERASGANVTRSLRERLPVDLIWHPAALLPRPGVRWEAIDSERARVFVDVDGESQEMVFHIAPDGALRKIRTHRWGNAGARGTPYREVSFGIDVIEETAFGAVTIPTRVLLSWEPDSEEPLELFRPEIIEAIHR